MGGEIAMSRRIIFKVGLSAQQEVRDLLQSIFVLELLAPSGSLLITSPWISAELGVIDNRFGRFDDLLPEAGPRWVTLAEVLSQLSLAGSKVVVVTRPDARNEAFLSRLRYLCGDSSMVPTIHKAEAENFHIKGLLGDGFWLKGSMNLTFSGVEINDELVEYTVDEAEVAKARSESSRLWPHADQGKSANAP